MPQRTSVASDFIESKTAMPKLYSPPRAKTGTDNVTKDSSLQVPPSLRPTRERIGLVVDDANAAADTIAAAEAAEVRQIWMNQPPLWPDVLTTQKNSPK
jgi:hypothetical protein